MSIEIGISGLSPEEYSKVDCLPGVSEIELASYLTWTSRERKALTQALRNGHRLVGACSSAWLFSHSLDSGLVVEKFSILRELKESLELRGVLVRLQARHLHSDVSSQLPGDLDFRVHWDFPQSARESAAQWKLSRHSLVWDPLWDSASDFAGKVCKENWIAKVHGWHPSRWIRRYGAEQIADCVRSLSTHCSGSGLLLIAHSQRREQWQDFERALSG
jgi:hypothetical protein